MTYTYCAETTDLTDAEIVAIIRHQACCEEGGEVDEGGLNMLHLKAGCDLEWFHAGPHASFQASDQSGKVTAWLAWPSAVLAGRGVPREITWPAECPVKAEDGVSCMLFDGHEGAHLHYGGRGVPPAWLRHSCSGSREGEAAITRTPPPPTFPHGIYGVNLTLVGDEGAMMAEGHVPLVRFVAACNNLSRNEFGCRNLLDYSEATLTEALEGTRHTWVLPTGNPDGDCDWYVKYDATAETPGAVPVTLWEP